MYKVLLCMCIAIILLIKLFILPCSCCHCCRGLLKVPNVLELTLGSQEFQGSTAIFHTLHS